MRVPVEVRVLIEEAEALRAAEPEPGFEITAIQLFEGLLWVTLALCVIGTVISLWGALDALYLSSQGASQT